MTTTREANGNDRRNRIAWIILGMMVLIFAVVILIVMGNRPPQLGADERVFNTVDALYTAIRNQDDARVRECEQRLHSYRDEGMLSKKAAEFLDDVIAMARSGKWEAAAKKLYKFMLTQRRDSV